MTRRLRVLFITPWYPSAKNPVHGVFVREHAKAVQIFDDVVVLHLAGYTAHLKPLWNLYQDKDPEFTEGIPTYRVEQRQLPIAIATYGLHLWSVAQAARVIRQQGFKPDIVHAHVYNSGVPAALIAKLLRVPMVLTEHSSAFPRRRLSLRQRKIARLAMAQAKVVMPVSLALQRAIEAYGIRANFRVVPNAADNALFYPAAARTREIEQPVRLLFVGSLIRAKGIAYLLSALERISENWSDWQLDLVGDGPDRAEFEALATRLGLSSKVIFHGLQPKSTVAVFMRNADLFVLPSLWENLPCVIIEAMACGLPVVSCQVGGIPELVSEQTGILVPSEDSLSLAAAITQVLETPDRFESDTIVQQAHRFSPAIVGRTISSVYSSALK